MSIKLLLFGFIGYCDGEEKTNNVDHNEAVSLNDMNG